MCASASWSLWFSPRMTSSLCPPVGGGGGVELGGTEELGGVELDGGVEELGGAEDVGGWLVGGADDVGGWLLGGVEELGADELSLADGDGEEMVLTSSSGGWLV